MSAAQPFFGEPLVYTLPGRESSPMRHRVELPRSGGHRDAFAGNARTMAPTAHARVTPASSRSLAPISRTPRRSDASRRRRPPHDRRRAKPPPHEHSRHGVLADETVPPRRGASATQVLRIAITSDCGNVAAPRVAVREQSRALQPARPSFGRRQRLAAKDRRRLTGK